MFRNSVGELIYWMNEATDDYDIATSMSKYLMSQGEITFGENRSEPSSSPDESGDWT